MSDNNQKLPPSFDEADDSEIMADLNSLAMPSTDLPDQYILNDNVWRELINKAHEDLNGAFENYLYFISDDHESIKEVSSKVLNKEYTDDESALNALRTHFDDELQKRRSLIQGKHSHGFLSAPKNQSETSTTAHKKPGVNRP